MSNKNKIYWFEGVTKKGVEALLNDENSKFRWLRPQRNRRAIVILMSLGLLLTSMGSYWPTLKTNLNLSDGVGVIVYSASAIFVSIRNTSFRYAYFILGYIVLGLMVIMSFGPELKMFQADENDGSYLLVASLFACASLPSMVMAWRERDI
jgi:hypothetical protein